ncbi:hypothetical protein IFM89_028540 [Coptis chinensis]|uniref:Glutaredoxin domain-containing protein n=1 Tax=Coptis chinensis TaxID=261450 RepID=A0A835M6Z4_9MAGN|nr:hypothetical protein IFM89_028540 [Coptis chinensis]
MARRSKWMLDIVLKSIMDGVGLLMTITVSVSTSLVNGKVKKNYRDSYQSMKMNYFDISDVHEVPFENSTKPLWQHLSEELILAGMDSNVVSSFRKAELAKKMGFNHYKIMRSPVCEDKVMHLVDNKVQLPGTKDRIVIYYTSLRGIRRTYEDCCILRTIFKDLSVLVDERDIIMDSAYRKELQTALDKSSVSLPQVFIKGGYLGRVEEVKQLHEDGELAKLVQDFPVQEPGFVCENCGDARFVPCSSCSGSRKVFVEEDGQLTRCLDCNENGLLRCPSCCS